MDKTKILFKSFKFQGDVIKEGSTLNFKAMEPNGNIFDISKLKGVKIISIFPKLNTKVCDKQTYEMARLSSLHPNANLISISLDEQEVQRNWCLANQKENIKIVWDLKLKEFSDKTNLYIPKLKTLGRGLLVLDNDNKIIKSLINKDIAKQPNFDEVIEFLK